MQDAGKERRLKPRFVASLPCALSLPDQSSDILFPREKMECRTRDLSESGVGLVAPSIYIGYTCVVDEGRALLLTLDLPSESVRVGATSAHYLRAADSSGEPVYLIGLRITEMSDEHRSHYTAFLDALADAEQV